MASGLSDRAAGVAVPPVTTKILVAGGFGAGKTTLVGTISEVRPLRTEEALTDIGLGGDDVSAVRQKAPGISPAWSWRPIRRSAAEPGRA
jgi:hypothetical protein